MAANVTSEQKEIVRVASRPLDFAYYSRFLARMGTGAGPLGELPLAVNWFIDSDPVVDAVAMGLPGSAGISTVVNQMGEELLKNAVLEAGNWLVQKGVSKLAAAGVGAAAGSIVPGIGNVVGFIGGYLVGEAAEWAVSAASLTDDAYYNNLIDALGLNEDETLQAAAPAAKRGPQFSREIAPKYALVVAAMTAVEASEQDAIDVFLGNEYVDTYSSTSISTSDEGLAGFDKDVAEFVRDTFPLRVSLAEGIVLDTAIWKGGKV